MKRLISIFLLFCFGLYQFGFFILSFWMPIAIQNYWEKEAWNYNLTSVLNTTLVIPFPRPYGQDQEDYQVANFSIELKGKKHRVIYQQYKNDSLHLVAVPDKFHDSYRAQLTTWIASLNEGEAAENTPFSQKLLLKSFLKDFIPQENLLSLKERLLSSRVVSDLKPYLFSTPTAEFELDLPPPERLTS
ncbi:hypothetical protein [Algoriphagus sp.]|uniref:hypothetical protein n=1 Tax=Algoriphagus sp. TaxID=1872435 RepID=UPI00391BCAD8